MSIYYKNYISYFLQNIGNVLRESSEAPQFTEPVDIVFAGGSSMVKGFLDVVKKEIEEIDMGVDIGKIKLAEDPFTSVARGCLFNAINVE